MGILQYYFLYEITQLRFQILKGQNYTMIFFLKHVGRNFFDLKKRLQCFKAVLDTLVVWFYSFFKNTKFFFFFI